MEDFGNELWQWILILSILGCDGVIGSDQRRDHCGLCGGDNGTCRIVTGLYTMPHLPYGYHLVATIPKGACNINITEMKPSANFLALRYLNGSYILNGDYVIHWSGSYEAVGTVFGYQRDAVPSRVEWLRSRGPTVEAVDLMIFSRRLSSLVKYEYILSLKDTTTSWPKLVHTPLYAIPTTSHETSPGSPSHLSSKGGPNGKNREGPSVERKRQHPRNGPDDPLAQEDNPVARDDVQQSLEAGNRTADGVHFKWHVAGTSECSRSCGGGVRKSTVLCMQEPDLTVVTDHHCDLSLRPDPLQTRCNTEPCPPEWTTTEWSNCTATCGEGTRKRDIACKQMVSSSLHITVAEHLCGDQRPDVSQKCNRGPCLHRWKSSKWSECSVQCGKGVRRRRVYCVDHRGQRVRADHCDAANEPSTEETCDRGQCPLTARWFVSQWSSQCFSECGQGLQLRRATCLDQNGSLRDTCSASEKPEVMRSCDVHRSCQAKWFTGPWQPCSSSCGPGIQRREVLCLSLYRGQYKTATDDTCVRSERPPFQQPCHLKPCAPEWFTSEWGRCSQSCDTGIQLREVKCLDGHFNLSHDCHNAEIPSVMQNCNTERCVLGRQGDPVCTDMYSNCQLVVQARMCRRSTYRKMCCHSCYNHR